MIERIRKKVKTIVTKREVLLFLGFYVGSVMLYYTASWVSFGAFQGGHPSYFSVEEFFAAAGSLFIINFLLSVPIWYVLVIRLGKQPLPVLIGFHLLALALFLASTYGLLLVIISVTGWVMVFGGYSTVWNFYINTLFYVVQFGLVHAYIYHKRYKRELTEKADLRAAVLQSEITALKAQLNPHFLHNLFNSINATIPPENERTRELIIQLSDLFRYQNAAAQKDLVTIEEDLAFIQNYLALIKVRIKERIRVRYEIDQACLSTLIPPMILQPLVENAVTHGISPKVGASELCISIQKKDNRVQIVIADTGVGIADKKVLLGEGLGLLNTRLRLMKAYQSVLKIEDNQPSGLKVSFVL